MEKYENVRKLINEYYTQKHVYNNIRRDLYPNFPLLFFTYYEIMEFAELIEWNELWALTEFLDDSFNHAENEISGHQDLKVPQAKVPSNTEEHFMEGATSSARNPDTGGLYATEIDIYKDREAATQDMLDDVDFSDADDDLIEQFRAMLPSRMTKEDTLPVVPLQAPILREYRQRQVHKPINSLEEARDYSKLEYHPLIKYSILDSFNVLLDETCAPDIESHNLVVRSSDHESHITDNFKMPDIPSGTQQKSKTNDSPLVSSLAIPNFSGSSTNMNIMPYISSAVIDAPIPMENISELQLIAPSPVVHNIDTSVANLPGDGITIPKENVEIRPIRQTPKNWQEILRKMKRVMYHNTDMPIPRKKRRIAIDSNQSPNQRNILQNGEPISNVGQIIDEYFSNMNEELNQNHACENPMTNILTSMEQLLGEEQLLGAEPSIPEISNANASNANENLDLFEQQYERWKKSIADMETSDILNAYPRYDINLKEFIAMGKELSEILKNVLQRDSVNINELLSRNVKKAIAVKRIKALLELKTRSILSFETLGTNITQVRFDCNMEN